MAGGGTNSRYKDQAGNKERVASEPLGEERSRAVTLRRGSRWGLVVFLLHWSVVSATPGGQLCVTLTISAATSARFCLWVLQPCSSDGLRGAGGDRSSALSPHVGCCFTLGSKELSGGGDGSKSFGSLQCCGASGFSIHKVRFIIAATCRMCGCCGREGRYWCAAIMPAARTAWASDGSFLFLKKNPNHKHFLFLRKWTWGEEE